MKPSSVVVANQSPFAARSWLGFVALAVIAVAILVWWYAPARVVERRTRALLEVVSIPPGTGGAARLMRPDSLRPFLSETVRFKTPADEVNGALDRDDIVAGFAHVATQAKETRFRMVARRALAVTGDHANIRLVLDARANLAGHPWNNGRYDASIDWQKTKDGWQVTAVEISPPSLP